jgi:predicted DNA-binding protein
MNTTKKMTTIRIENEAYSRFKNESVKDKLTLQYFIEKCIHLYINSPKFKFLVNNSDLVIEAENNLLKNTIIVAESATTSSNSTTSSLQ